MSYTGPENELLPGEHQLFALLVRLESLKKSLQMMKLIMILSVMIVMKKKKTEAIVVELK